jgi:hypothetical protein
VRVEPEGQVVVRRRDEMRGMRVRVRMRERVTARLKM